VRTIIGSAHPLENSAPCLERQAYIACLIGKRVAFHRRFIVACCTSFDAKYWVVLPGLPLELDRVGSGFVIRQEGSKVA